MLAAAAGHGDSLGWGCGPRLRAWAPSNLLACPWQTGSWSFSFIPFPASSSSSPTHSNLVLTLPTSVCAQVTDDLCPQVRVHLVSLKSLTSQRDPAQASLSLPCPRTPPPPSLGCPSAPPRLPPGPTPTLLTSLSQPAMASQAVAIKAADAPAWLPFCISVACDPMLLSISP